MLCLAETNEDSGKVSPKQLTYLAEFLSGIPGCIVYLDDILVFAVLQAEHDTALHKALEQRHQHDFCLNMSKCLFGCQSVIFLGHVTSQGRIKTPSTYKD